jgi:hypothetical protein
VGPRAGLDSSVFTTTILQTYNVSYRHKDVASMEKVIPIYARIKFADVPLFIKFSDVPLFILYEVI